MSIETEPNQDLTALTKYLSQLTGLEPEEVVNIAKRWLCTTPQTTQQVEDGKKWEEENRGISADQTWAMDFPEDPNSNP